MNEGHIKIFHGFHTYQRQLLRNEYDESQENRREEIPRRYYLHQVYPFDSSEHVYYLTGATDLYFDSHIN